MTEMRIARTDSSPRIKSGAQNDKACHPSLREGSRSDDSYTLQAGGLGIAALAGLTTRAWWYDATKQPLKAAVVAADRADALLRQGQAENALGFYSKAMEEYLKGAVGRAITNTHTDQNGAFLKRVELGQAATYVALAQYSDTHVRAKSSFLSKAVGLYQRWDDPRLVETQYQLVWAHRGAQEYSRAEALARLLLDGAKSIEDRQHAHRELAQTLQDVADHAQTRIVAPRLISAFAAGELTPADIPQEFGNRGVNDLVRALDNAMGQTLEALWHGVLSGDIVVLSGHDDREAWSQVAALAAELGQLTLIPERRSGEDTVLRSAGASYRVAQMMALVVSGNVAAATPVALSLAKSHLAEQNLDMGRDLLEQDDPDAADRWLRTKVAEAFHAALKATWQTLRFYAAEELSHMRVPTDSLRHYYDKVDRKKDLIMRIYETLDWHYTALAQGFEPQSRHVFEPLVNEMQYWLDSLITMGSMQRLAPETLATIPAAQGRAYPDFVQRATTLDAYGNVDLIVDIAHHLKRDPQFVVSALVEGRHPELQAAIEPLLGGADATRNFVENRLVWTQLRARRGMLADVREK